VDQLVSSAVSASMNRDRRLSASELVAGGIRLSARALARDKARLAGQLLGRLQGEVSDEIKPLLKDATKWNVRPWLRSVSGDLTPPVTRYRWLSHGLGECASGDSPRPAGGVGFI
jgi:hypothetical protein